MGNIICDLYWHMSVTHSQAHHLVPVSVHEGNKNDNKANLSLGDISSITCHNPYDESLDYVNLFTGISPSKIHTMPWVT